MSAQLVEALRAVLGYADLCDMPAAQEACQKARAAIAAAEAPTVAQPVAWLYWHPRDDTYDGPDTARKIAVSRFTDDTRRAMSLDGWLFEPLYRAAPPQPVPLPSDRQPFGDLRNAKWLDPECYGAGACQSLKFKAQPVPLTDEQIAEANEDCGDPIPFSFDVVPLVRACIAEFCRINGIGGKA